MKLATGTQIDFARRKLKLTLIKFGELTGVSDKTIKTIEKSEDSICGKVRPETLAKVTENAENALKEIGWHLEPEGGISPIPKDSE